MGWQPYNTLGDNFCVKTLLVGLLYMSSAMELFLDRPWCLRKTSLAYQFVVNLIVMHWLFMSVFLGLLWGVQHLTVLLCTCTPLLPCQVMCIQCTSLLPFQCIYQGLIHNFTRFKAGQSALKNWLSQCVNGNDQRTSNQLGGRLRNRLGQM